MRCISSLPRKFQAVGPYEIREKVLERIVSNEGNERYFPR